MTSRIDIRSIVPNNSLNVWFENSRQSSVTGARQENFDKFSSVMEQILQKPEIPEFRPNLRSGILNPLSQPYIPKEGR